MAWSTLQDPSTAPQPHDAAAGLLSPPPVNPTGFDHQAGPSPFQQQAPQPPAASPWGQQSAMQAPAWAQPRTSSAHSNGGHGPQWQGGSYAPPQQQQQQQQWPPSADAANMQAQQPLPDGGLQGQWRPEQAAGAAGPADAAASYYPDPVEPLGEETSAYAAEQGRPVGSAAPHAPWQQSQLYQQGAVHHGSMPQQAPQQHPEPHPASATAPQQHPGAPQQAGAPFGGAGGEVSEMDFWDQQDDTEGPNEAATLFANVSKLPSQELAAAGEMADPGVQLPVSGGPGGHEAAPLLAPALPEAPAVTPSPEVSAPLKEAMSGASPQGRALQPAIAEAFDSLDPAAPAELQQHPEPGADHQAEEHLKEQPGAVQEGGAAVSTAAPSPEDGHASAAPLPHATPQQSAPQEGIAPYDPAQQQWGAAPQAWEQQPEAPGPAWDVQQQLPEQAPPQQQWGAAPQPWEQQPEAPGPAWDTQQQQQQAPAQQQWGAAPQAWGQQPHAPGPAWSSQQQQVQGPAWDAQQQHLWPQQQQQQLQQAAYSGPPAPAWQPQPSYTPGLMPPSLQQQPAFAQGAGPYPPQGGPPPPSPTAAVARFTPSPRAGAGTSFRATGPAAWAAAQVRPPPHSAAPRLCLALYLLLLLPTALR